MNSTSNHNIKKKIMSAKEAISQFVKDGDMIALGGFTVSRNPMTLIREIIRQKLQNLHLVVHSQGQGMDLLIGANCIKYLEIAYGGTGRFAPTCIRFRNAVQSGELIVEDYTNFQMSLRFLAGSLGLPFIPCYSGLATDLLTKKGFPSKIRNTEKIAKYKAVLSQNPFSNEKNPILLLPALNPDVTLIHAQYAGDDGTIRIKGLTFLDIEQARAAKHVIVSCEEIVPASYLRQDPDQNSISPFLIDAIVVAPYGAHPTACHYFYDYDPQYLNMYKIEASEDKSFQTHLKQWIFDTTDQEAYLNQVGAANLIRIRANTKIGYSPGLERR